MIAVGLAGLLWLSGALLRYPIPEYTILVLFALAVGYSVAILWRS